MVVRNKRERIRIGNQNASAIDDPMIPFEYAMANGFDAFEWFPDRRGTDSGLNTIDMDDGIRTYIRGMARVRDIKLSVHAPWWANPNEPEGLVLLMKALTFAGDIGATLFNIHLSLDKGIETYIGSIRKIIHRTAQMDIKLSLENTPLTLPEDFNQTFRLLKKIVGNNTDHVGMCLDLGHANICDQTRNDYLSFMDRLDRGVPIIHIHLHENYGDRDSHMTVFTGPSKKDETGLRGFIKRLKKRDFSGAIILEQWPNPPTLLNYARDRLRRLFEDVTY